MIGLVNRNDVDFAIGIVYESKEIIFAGPLHKCYACEYLQGHFNHP